MNNLPPLQLFPSLSPGPEPRRQRQMRTKFTLDAEFFSELLDRLHEKENQRPDIHEMLRGRKGGPPSGWVRNPSRPERTFTNLGQTIISELIESVFWASLERDEGRALRFSVAYRCLTNVDLNSNGGLGTDQDIIFATPLPFTVKELKKLGPAISGDACVLVSADENNQLTIRGISADPFLPLKVTIVDPGHLTLSYYGDNIAFVSGSEVGFIKFSAFEINTIAVWRRLYGAEAGYPIHGDARVQTITRTLKKMRELGNGGALLVVPKRKKFASIGSIAYPSPEGFKQSSEQIRAYNDDGDDAWRGYFVDRCANMLAHLTAVDGATIITRNLELIGFGAKLKATTQPPTIYQSHPIDHPQSFRRVNLTDLGNLRHQSAARFVSREKNSVAFVVSQDGNITSIVWMEKEGGAEPYLLIDTRLDLTLF